MDWEQAGKFFLAPTCHG